MIDSGVRSTSVHQLVPRFCPVETPLDMDVVIEIAREKLEDVKFETKAGHIRMSYPQMK